MFCCPDVADVPDMAVEDGVGCVEGAAAAGVLFSFGSVKNFV